jgi:hypothetical protein
MTPDQIIAELEALLPTSDAEDALTAHEWAKLMGRSIDRVRPKLVALHGAGRLEVVTVRRHRIDGRPISVPAYRLLPKA